MWLAYCRKSRINVASRKAVESTDRQRDRIQAWADAREEAVEFFVEPDGYRSGGSTRHRPAYAAMMERIAGAKPGTVRGVVVTKIDRTSRNVSDFFSFLDELQKRKLEYVALDQSFDTTTSHGKLILGVLVLLAAWERDMMRDRASEHALDKQERGYYWGSDVYGYKRGRLTLEDGTTQSVLVVDESVADHIREVYRLYLGGMSVRHLAMHANREGWHAPRGPGIWYTRAIHRLLDRAHFYAGDVLLHTETRAGMKRLPGHHPPIVSRETADAVLRERERRGVRDVGGRPPRRDRIYILTGRVWCATCGARVHAQAGNLGRTMYYRCPRERGCGEPAIRSDRAEGPVLNAISDALRRLQGSEMGRAATLAYLGGSEAPVPSRSSADAGRLRQTAERLDKLYLWGRIGEDEYERERARISQEIEAATAQETHDPETSRRRYLDMWQELGESLDNVPRSALRVMVQELVSRVETQGGEVTRIELVPELLSVIETAQR